MRMTDGTGGKHMPWYILSYIGTALNVIMTVLVILACLKYLLKK